MSYYVRVRDKPSHLGTPVYYVRVLVPQPAPCATFVRVRDKPCHHGTPVYYVRVWGQTPMCHVRVWGGLAPIVYYVRVGGQQ